VQNNNTAAALVLFTENSTLKDINKFLKLTFFLTFPEQIVSFVFNKMTPYPQGKGNN